MTFWLDFNELFNKIVCLAVSLIDMRDVIDAMMKTTQRCIYSRHVDERERGSEITLNSVYAASFASIPLYSS